MGSIVVPMEVPDVKLITPQVFGDERGFFEETYHARKYPELGVDLPMVQDNWSRSVRGTLRGLHYQLRQPQAKLVWVIRGEVFDVAVDLRRGSPTFGQWVGALLTEVNHHQLYVPVGFAHGFCVVSESADFVYKCSDFYVPEDERGILWNDPVLAIPWPAERPILSKRDLSMKPLAQVPAEDLPVYRAGVCIPTGCPNGPPGA